MVVSTSAEIAAQGATVCAVFRQIFHRIITGNETTRGRYFFAPLRDFAIKTLARGLKSAAPTGGETCAFNTHRFRIFII